ncbi:hypothetical protein [Botryobacter ruber]|uniref:hypothetical protein n=1 Tax=Botryobacter ruber TaxID=2171629 RepID=UPI000E0A277E|nr:hypothetical protein [Botryobacter ruber]
MNRIFLTVTAIAVIACQNRTNQETHQIEEPVPTEVVATKTQEKDTLNFNSLSPLGMELKKAISDPATDKYFIEIFNKGKAVSHPDDNKMLSITDSLFSKDQNKDFFYFVVFSKSMDGADGYYSEAAGEKATEFVLQKTERFADYFNIGPTLTDNDMRNWARSIVGEIQIEREGEEAQAINELLSLLRANIRTGRKEYSTIIEKFIGHLKGIEKERITNH